MSETRRCGHCGSALALRKPSDAKRFCNHSCAALSRAQIFADACRQPAVIKKRSDKRRGSGKGTGYLKENGRHIHRQVAERKLGRPLRPGEIAHHVNEDKRDNDDENIEVLPSQSEHARLHFAGASKVPKAVCKSGHPLTPENTRGPRRRCVTCTRTYDAQWKRDQRKATRCE